MTIVKRDFRQLMHNLLLHLAIFIGMKKAPDKDALHFEENKQSGRTERP